MGKSVVKKALIAVVEAVIQPYGSLMLPRWKRKQSAIFLKLVHDKLVQCEVSQADERIAGSSWIDGQNTLQPNCESRGRKKRWQHDGREVRTATNHRVARIVGQPS